MGISKRPMGCARVPRGSNPRRLHRNLGLYCVRHLFSGVRIYMFLINSLKGLYAFLFSVCVYLFSQL